MSDFNGSLIYSYSHSSFDDDRQTNAQTSSENSSQDLLKAQSSHSQPALAQESPQSHFHTSPSWPPERLQQLPYPSEGDSGPSPIHERRQTDPESGEL